MGTAARDGISRGPRVLGLVAWIGVLGAVLAGFTAVGSGPLAGPPLTAPDQWGAWASSREPVEAAFAVLRLVVLGLAWYLLVSTLLATAVRLSRVGRLVSVADVLTLPAVRRIVQGAVGVGMLSTVAAGVVSATGGPGPGPTRADVQLAASALDAHPEETATIRRVEDGSPVTTEPPVTTESPVTTEPPVTTESPVTTEPVEPGPPTWTVQAGDHLWSIAERVLTASWPRPASAAEIAPYWRALIAANRAELIDPDNPDLIHPGQVFQLPPPPAP